MRRQEDDEIMRRQRAVAGDALDANIFRGMTRRCAFSARRFERRRLWRFSPMERAWTARTFIDTN
jgi:hypothetical protein